MEVKPKRKPKTETRRDDAIALSRDVAVLGLQVVSKKLAMLLASPKCTPYDLKEYGNALLVLQQAAARSDELDGSSKQQSSGPVRGLVVVPADMDAEDWVKAARSHREGSPKGRG